MLEIIMNFIQRHAFALSITAGVGAGFLLTKRYCAGGRCTSIARLDGKTVVITGANTGIGKETAVDLARRGAKVIIACRDVTKAERAADFIKNRSGNQQVVAEKLDLASLKSVRAFADKFKKANKELHILVNNAGVMMCPQWETEDGFEMQLGTNHLGHFLLTNELLDMLKASAPSRVVTVSSTAHRGGKIHWEDLQLKNNYDPRVAYSQSKLANVLFTRELHNRILGTGVTAYSLHPGVILTELPRHLPTWLKALFRPLSLLFFKTPEQGAQTSIYCAVEEGIENNSGKYFSDCALGKVAPQGDSDEDARRLWDMSEKLVGLKWT